MSGCRSSCAPDRSCRSARRSRYAAEKPATAAFLHVFTGADGAFSLYEDDGTSLGYQNGAWSRVPIVWDEHAQALTIGARQGAFPGMLQARTFRIRWMRPGRALDLDGADKEVRYDGAPVTVRLNQP